MQTIGGWSCNSFEKEIVEYTFVEELVAVYPWTLDLLLKVNLPWSMFYIHPIIYNNIMHACKVHFKAIDLIFKLTKP